jgi:predicted TIM-barrel fold metal-dependent hydrolase
MIYDADTWIGHWPYSRLPHTTAADLLRQMDAAGIDKALVGSLQGIFYMDSHEANRELAGQVRRHRDRLIPCAILDPSYFGWADDLKQCRQEWDMPVLRLIPQYHQYRLTDTAAEEIVAAAHKLKMRVALYGRIIDLRGRSRLDRSRNVGADEIMAIFRKFHGDSFMLLNSRAVKPPGGAKAPKIYQDVAQMHGTFRLGIETGLKTCTADRLMFGSTMLLRCPSPALMAVEQLDITKAAREKILYKNLKRLVPEMA